MRALGLAILTVVYFSAAPVAAGAELKAMTRPGQQVALNPMVDGRVAKIFVSEGERVKRGRALLRLDDEVQAARVRLTQKSATQLGKVDKASQKLARAKKRYQRLRMARSGSVPRWEIEEAGFDIRIAEADLKLAADALALERGKLALEEKVLSQYQINAPFSGEVVAINIDAGATVKRSEQLITISDLTMLKAIAYIPVDRVLEFNVGHGYTVQISDSPFKHVVATLRYVDQRVEPASRTFRAIFEIDNREGRIPAGAQITILARTSQQH